MGWARPVETGRHGTGWDSNRASLTLRSVLLPQQEPVDDEGNLLSGAKPAIYSSQQVYKLVKKQLWLNNVATVDQKLDPN